MLLVRSGFGLCLFASVACVTITDYSPAGLPSSPPTVAPTTVNPEVQALDAAQRSQLENEWLLSNYSLWFRSNISNPTVFVDGQQLPLSKYPFAPNDFRHRITLDTCRASIAYHGEAHGRWNDASTPRRVIPLRKGLYLEASAWESVLCLLAGANNARGVDIHPENTSVRHYLRNFFNDSPDVAFTVELYVPIDNPLLSSAVKMPDGTEVPIPDAASGRHAVVPLGCGQAVELVFKYSGPYTGSAQEDISVLLMPPGGPPAFMAVFPVKRHSPAP